MQSSASNRFGRNRSMAKGLVGPQRIPLACSALNVQTLTEADGKVGWGVYGSTWAYREGAGGGEAEKRKAYAVVVDGWRIVSGAVIASGESVTIVVEHVR
jgi:hypothetical protein